MSTRRFARLLPLLVVAGVVPFLDVLFAAPQERKPRKVAFLVGVGKYDHKFSDLGTAPENDVGELAKTLGDGGFEVVTLTGTGTGGNRATKANVEGRFKDVLRGGGGKPAVKDGDTVLVVLCGHGVQDKAPDPATGKGEEQPFYCPVDAWPDDTTTMVPLNGLIRASEASGATTLFLVDACRDVPPDVNRGTRTGIQGKKVVLPAKTAVLFSCGQGQLAHQDSTLGVNKKGHGLFTYAVLKSLRGDGTARRVSWTRLVTEVEEAFDSDEIKAMLPKGKTQSPVLATGELGATELFAAKSGPAPKVDGVTPPANVMAKKPDDMAKRDLLPGEKVETFDYVMNDTEAKKGTRRVLTLDLGGGVTMDVVRITAGTFTMGSPAGEKDRSDDEAEHEVTLTKDFYLGKHEVTQAQYEAIMGMEKNKSNFKGKQLPVEMASWDEATAYCKLLGDKVKRKVELPSEAQWEFACRAGTKTPFHFGSKLSGDHANHNGDYPYGTETKGEYKKTTVDVGNYKANGFGLYDLHGNVWEWCRDYYGPYDKLGTATNPLQLTKQPDDRRVLRGGSWNHGARYCRAADRNWNAPDDRYSILGFRVCLPLD